MNLDEIKKSVQETLEHYVGREINKTLLLALKSEMRLIPGVTNSEFDMNADNSLAGRVETLVDGKREVFLTKVANQQVVTEENVEHHYHEHEE